MRVDKPYFMQNSDWYYFNEKACKYELTDKAPAKAIKSYNDFYKIIESTLTTNK